jgi:murein DD-endopeptidase MepM/ murein hydrolase activator NlpD
MNGHEAHTRVPSPGLRRRGGARWGSLPIRAGCFLLLSFLAACGGGTGRGPDSQGAQAGIDRDDPEAYWTSWRDTVRQGDTLWDILDRQRVYMTDINKLLRNARNDGPFSWRRLKPGQVLEGTHDDLGSLRRVRYIQSPEEVFALEFSSDSILVAPVDVEKDVYWARLKAVVNNTVDGALRAAGGNHLLVDQLAEMLSWDVDFYTDPRRGDTIDVLVEEIYIDGEFFRFGDVQRVVYAGEKIRTEGIFYDPQGQGDGEYYDPAGRNLRKSFLKSPLNYSRISSRYSTRRFHPILKRHRPHLGVDYAAPSGTPVVAVADGEVEDARWNGGYGRYVKIRHSPSLATTYGHFQSIAKGIKKGVRVKQNQVIGYVGSSGLSTGPHLDFRVQRDGRFVDPLTFKKPPADPLPAGDRPRFEARLNQLAAEMGRLRPGQRIPAAPEIVLTAGTTVDPTPASP